MEDEMMGLAGTAGMTGPAIPAGGDQALLEEVIRLLTQGVDPEELVQQGVPVDIIKQAMEIIMSQAPVEGQMGPPSSEAGLAMTGMM